MFRIGHMGYVNRFDVLVAIAALETGLKEAGMDFETGAGVAAVQRAFLESG